MFPFERLVTGQRWLWVGNVGGGRPEALAEVLGRLIGADARCVEVAAPKSPDEVFLTYHGVRDLLVQWLPVIRTEAPGLEEEFAGPLAHVCPDLVGIAPGQSAAPAPDADSVTFAVVRRISRESLYNSHLVDALARFLLEAHRRCPSLRGPLWVVLRGCEGLDRPSLRVFYRTYRLALAEDGLRWLVFHAPLGELPEDLSDLHRLHRKLLQARAALLDRLRREVQAQLYLWPVQEGLYQSPVDPRYWTTSVPALSLEELIGDLATNLVEQNYERAYVRAVQALARVDGSERESEILRLVALVDANLGQYAEADATLRRAVELTRRPTFAAHLHYLMGLLQTKRFYDLDRAEACYHAGHEALKGADNNDPQVRLERAWLINGQALVRVLRARRLPREARTAELEDVIRMELDAFDLVRGMPGASESYLRFNLLANIAFVLEIMSRYPEAVNFWQRAFGQFLRLRGGKHFEKTFLFRLGLLQLKSGDADAAVSSLERALQLAREHDDRFSAERIAGGLAYALLRRDGPEIAYERYAEAAGIAFEIRDWLAFCEHLVAMLHCAARAGWTGRFRALVELARQVPDRNVLKERLEKLAENIDHDDDPGRPLTALLEEHGLHLPHPPPKLPAYVPLIDLEPTPDQDLNRLLADAPTPAIQRRVEL